MWLLFVVTLNAYPYKDTSTSTVVTEFSSRERCIAAAKFVKTRKHTADAYCVQK